MNSTPTTFYIAPGTLSSSVSSASLSLVRTLETMNQKVVYYKPISFSAYQEEKDILDTMGYTGAYIKPLSYQAFEEGGEGALEAIVNHALETHEKLLKSYDICVVEGLSDDENFNRYTSELNLALARALSAHVILVATPELETTPIELNQQIYLSSQNYGGISHSRLKGCIVVQKNNSKTETLEQFFSENPKENQKNQLTKEIILKECHVFSHHDFSLFGFVPFNKSLNTPSVLEISEHLQAESLNPHADAQRQVSHAVVATRHIASLFSLLKPGTLLFSGKDRIDLLTAAAYQELSGIKLGGIVFTQTYPPDELNPSILSLFDAALLSGLPLFQTKYDTYGAISKLESLSFQRLNPKNKERVRQSISHQVEHINRDALHALCKMQKETSLSAAAFRFGVFANAKAAAKKIVLPEASDARVLKAAVLCETQGIAKCILLGEQEKIQALAKLNGINLPKSLTIISPKVLEKRYVSRLVELRGHKGVDENKAREILLDETYLATMMVESGEADGFVSGAIHTTANTIRPAFQIIKTKKDAKIVSSVFFMCLEDKVLIYGDCAVNPNPTAEELADIAIQSAQTAKEFHIKPCIAMISYSTGSSGAGGDVDLVREATRLVKERAPDLLVDGPLQYDAATVPSVAAQKAPDSPVAGKANVFIFPDLNTGNTTYKAVQRSAKATSIGPVLQGLRYPVNDLSRGALVEDIVYTIAVTAIQATSIKR